MDFLSAKSKMTERIYRESRGKPGLSKLFIRIECSYKVSMNCCFKTHLYFTIFQVKNAEDILKCYSSKFHHNLLINSFLSQWCEIGGKRFDKLLQNDNASKAPSTRS